MTPTQPALSLPAVAVELRERLLGVMDRKHHWAWPRFTEPGLSRTQLEVHFRHEFAVYVRDFPVLLARLLGQGPPADVRALLAENLYEEQTGKLSMGVSHPELFLEMMDGLGIARARVDADVRAPDPAAPLEPEALAYRAFLDDASARAPWVVGAAVLTVFVEGSVNERAELAGTRALPPVDEAIERHPMVAHYGCPPERMRLVRAHREVESGHRDAAWTIVLGAVTTEQVAEQVFAATSRALELWLAYRDGVVRAMGLSRG